MSLLLKIIPTVALGGLTIAAATGYGRSASVKDPWQTAMVIGLGAVVLLGLWL